MRMVVPEGGCWMRSRVARVIVLLLAVPLLALGGCSGVGKLDSVSGKVTLDGKPLAGVSVNFIPDAQKGNKTELGVSGTTDSEGNYHLQTITRVRSTTYDGAPPGWYKVTIRPTLGESPEGTAGPKGKASRVPVKYQNPDQTPFHIEVVDAPQAGAYDLNLTSK
jgi:hypothetical protein